MKIKSTQEKEYANYLINSQGSGWKNRLDVQRPYRSKLQKLSLGKTLDIGCGIGRNLKALPQGSVGIDHNKYMVEDLTKKGYLAFTNSSFKISKYAKKNTFDSLLFAHIIEHMTAKEAKKMISDYLKYLKKNGNVLIICPQKKGFSKDSTHIQFHDRESISKILKELVLSIQLAQSFPFPELLGPIFAPNEYWVLAKKND